MASDETTPAPPAPGSQPMAIEDHYRLLLQKDVIDRQLRAIDLQRATLQAQSDQLQVTLDRIVGEAAGRASMQPRVGDAPQ